MSMTDPIADFLTRIRNAIHASHETVLRPAARRKAELGRILAEQGYIAPYNGAAATDAPGDVLEIRLRYDESRRSAITGLRRVSRPGRRTYVDAKHIPRVQGGMGTAIVSTSGGPMTGPEARAAGVGGEGVAEGGGM